MITMDLKMITVDWKQYPDENPFDFLAIVIHMKEFVTQKIQTTWTKIHKEFLKKGSQEQNKWIKVGDLQQALLNTGIFEEINESAEIKRGYCCIHCKKTYTKL
ncbi:hypothetical protein TKK_0004090 [Trichogramma kaykai]